MHYSTVKVLVSPYVQHGLRLTTRNNIYHDKDITSGYLLLVLVRSLVVVRVPCEVQGLFGRAATGAVRRVWVGSSSWWRELVAKDMTARPHMPVPHSGTQFDFVAQVSACPLSHQRDDSDFQAITNSHKSFYLAVFRIEGRENPNDRVVKEIYSQLQEKCQCQERGRTGGNVERCSG
jgi:hypothetical protein